MKSIDLFTPLKLGAIEAPNRIFMAPLTRTRAGEGNAPTELNALYYAQRASAGLIISEATQIAPTGQGYPHTPGLHSSQQVEGWKAVTRAVHEKGGRIFAQLWHVGRVSHPDFHPNGQAPIAPSAVMLDGDVQTFTEMKPRVMPRALQLNEIPGIIDQYRAAATNAKLAGFDGVEVHGANGYLLDQFLRDGTNLREDAYGGSIENRARLHLEVTRAVAEVFGADRVGVRLSPSGTMNGMRDSNPRVTFGYVITQLGKLGLAYLHIMESLEGDLRHGGDAIPVSFFRPMFDGTLVANAGFTFEKGNDYLAKGHADAIAFGVPFISNPDLPARFARRAPLAPADPKTFYGRDERGYTDYPTMAG